MSGIISDNQGRSSGLVKSAAASSDYKKLSAQTVSGVSSVSFDGFFTSDYNKYEMLGNDIECGTANGVSYFRTRTSDADNTGSYYSNSCCKFYHDVNNENWINAGSSGSSDLDSPTTYWKIDANSKTVSASNLYTVKYVLYAPLSATRNIGEFEDSSEASTVFAKAYGTGVYQNTALLSGMTFYVSAGTFSGTFTLYGYVK
jgi:hypothetical protein